MRQTSARALWYTAPGKVELREEPLADPSPDQIVVRSLFSGVSRGTERLVLSGAVGDSERERMRCPLQAGEFPFPVKYGYCAVGRVEHGNEDLLGRIVFVMHPHQDVFAVPATLAFLVPEEVPAHRATLAANMETALNALWDSSAGPADRIAVIGAGILGLLVGYLAGRLPGAEVTLVDSDESRREFADALGCRFALPDVAPLECDAVFHTSASAQGLATAIACAGLEAAIIELSWYGGECLTPAPLGGAFHSRRLKLISSQVGHVSPGRRPRWNNRRRMEAALRLLGDPKLDRLTSAGIAFEEAATTLPGLLRAGARGIGPIIHYNHETL